MSNDLAGVGSDVRFVLHCSANHVIAWQSVAAMDAAFVQTELHRNDLDYLPMPIRSTQ